MFIHDRTGKARLGKIKSGCHVMACYFMLYQDRSR
jgi:hypothetical protein